jgi:uncharacterized RDD family membrane protein YckC
MTCTHRHNTIDATPWRGLLFALAFLLLLGAAAPDARAADLDAVGDGEHLWLVMEDPSPPKEDEPRLVVYHLSDDAERGKMAKLEPITGELMPRGLAANEAELVIIRKDRSVVAIRPVMSPLLQRWDYQKATLPRLPDGCALVSIAVGGRGPWALVRVESAKTLKQLDEKGVNRPDSEEDLAALKRVLGLPPDFEFEPGGGAGNASKPDDNTSDAPDENAQRDDTPAAPSDGGDEDAGTDGEDFNGEDTESRLILPGRVFTSTEADDADDPGGDAAEDDDATGAGSHQGQAEDTQAEAPPTTPAYRLITTRGGRWVSSLLPDDFVAPKHAELLIRTGDARPTILAHVNIDGATPGQLVRYTPTAPDTDEHKDADASHDADTASPAPAWSKQAVSIQPTPLGPWTATHIDRQIAVVVERSRSDQAVSAEVLLLRGDEATGLERLTLPTDGPARWSAVPWGSGLALVARPGPVLETTGEDDEDAVEPVAGMIALNVLSGQIVREDENDSGVVVLYEGEPTAAQGNADLLIQIGAFVVAMVMMMLFYRRAPRGHQLDLPERVVLAGYGRRAAAGLVDLLPGFWLAGVLYDTTIGETLLYWPGNGVAKVIPAMRPGFVVIVVTVAHTTLFELLFARSLGKWFTGLYVADFTGKPATPGPAFVRAISRVFDLFAPLMLVLVVISPARQRLGDILARTIVVTREPETSEQKDANDDL